jgi:hypothetical protein
MKAIIKYFLNTIGLSFMIVGFAFDCPETVSKLLSAFGLMFYCSWSYWSCEDEAKQEEHIKKLEEKVEELENRSRKKYVKPKLSVENVPSNYEEYLKNKDRW